MKYLVIDIRKHDEFIEEFESKDEANEYAKDLYEQDQENKFKKIERVYALGITEENYEKVNNGEVEEWYADFAENEDEFFDSFDLK